MRYRPDCVSDMKLLITPATYVVTINN